MQTVRKSIIIATLVLSGFILPGISDSGVSAQGSGASIYLSPAQGTFEVGSTFNVSFFVDTGGADINAVRLDVSFPPEIIQISEPSVGNSFVSIWVEQPKYSNTSGTMSLQGGLPSPGINTSAGLISTVTFRARSPGSAVISVLNTSAVLANNGQGTDILSSRGSGIVQIILPVPEGPVVVSRSHVDMNRWYRDNNVSLHWNLNGVEGIYEGVPVEYSWELDKDPSFIPDNEPEGTQTSTQYEGVEDGVWYFHIKARTGGEWGSATHMPIMIDASKPAEFTPIVEPLVGPSDARRIATFITSDRHSGIEHYELRISSLTDPGSMEFFFVEQQNPYTIPTLEEGLYELTVRAYDGAGNWRDGVTEFEVHTHLFRVVNGKVIIGDHLFSGVEFALISALFLTVLLVVILLARQRYRKFRRRNPNFGSSIKERLRDFLNRRKGSSNSINKDFVESGKPKKKGADVIL